MTSFFLERWGAGPRLTRRCLLQVLTVVGFMGAGQPRFVRSSVNQGTTAPSPGSGAIGRAESSPTAVLDVPYEAELFVATYDPYMVMRPVELLPRDAIIPKEGLPDELTPPPGTLYHSFTGTGAAPDGVVPRFEIYSFGNPTVKTLVDFREKYIALVESKGGKIGGYDERQLLSADKELGPLYAVEIFAQMPDTAERPAHEHHAMLFPHKDSFWIAKADFTPEPAYQDEYPLKFTHMMMNGFQITTS